MARTITLDEVAGMKKAGASIKSADTTLDKIGERLAPKIEGKEGLSKLLEGVRADLYLDKSWPTKDGAPVGVGAAKDQGNALGVAYNRLQAKLRGALAKKEKAAKVAAMALEIERLQGLTDEERAADAVVNGNPESIIETAPAPSFEDATRATLEGMDIDQLSILAGLVEQEIAKRKAA